MEEDTCLKESHDAGKPWPKSPFLLENILSLGDLGEVNGVPAHELQDTWYARSHVTNARCRYVCCIVDEKCAGSVISRAWSQYNNTEKHSFPKAEQDNKQMNTLPRCANRRRKAFLLSPEQQHLHRQPDSNMQI
jgi:hypothetical protein